MTGLNWSYLYFSVQSTRPFSAPGDNFISPAPNESFNFVPPVAGTSILIESVTNGPGVAACGRLTLNPQAMLASVSIRNAEINFAFIWISFWGYTPVTWKWLQSSMGFFQ